MAGKYRAVIRPLLEDVRIRKNSQAPPVIDASYQNFATSRLDFEVTSDPDQNSFTLKVKRGDQRRPPPK
jgi:hypothetical protein